MVPTELLSQLPVWAQWVVVVVVLLLPSVGLYFASIRPGQLERKRQAQTDLLDRFKVQKELIGDRLDRLGEVISRTQEGLTIQSALLELPGLGDDERALARDRIAESQRALRDLEHTERELRRQYDKLRLPGEVGEQTEVIVKSSDTSGQIIISDRAEVAVESQRPPRPQAKAETASTPQWDRMGTFIALFQEALRASTGLPLPDVRAARRRYESVATQTDEALRSATELNVERMNALEAQLLALQRQLEQTPRIHVGTDEPTDAKEGDLWFEPSSRDPGTASDQEAQS